MILNSIFNFGENYYYGNSSSNWISFIITLTGVFVGAMLAYFIAIAVEKRQNKIDKERENAKTASLNNDRLNHLTNLIDSAISIAEKQSVEYFELAEELTKKPYEIHLVKITLTNDIQRIKQLDNQKIFDAYTNALESNSDRIKNYNKLFHKIDFLDLKLSQMMDIQAKQTDFTFKDQCFVRDIIDDLVISLTILAVEFTESYPGNYKENSVYIFVTDLLKKSSASSDLGFAFFEDEFINPLRDNCRELFSFDKNLANLVLEKTKRANARMRHIKYNSLAHAESCKALKGEIGQTIIDLRNLVDEIKKNVP